MGDFGEAHEAIYRLQKLSEIYVKSISGDFQSRVCGRGNLATASRPCQKDFAEYVLKSMTRLENPMESEFPVMQKVAAFAIFFRMARAGLEKTREQVAKPTKLGAWAISQMEKGAPVPDSQRMRLLDYYAERGIRPSIDRDRRRAAAVYQDPDVRAVEQVAKRRAKKRELQDSARSLRGVFRNPEA